MVIAGYERTRILCAQIFQEKIKEPITTFIGIETRTIIRDRMLEAIVDFGANCLGNFADQPFLIGTHNFTKFGRIEWRNGHRTPVS